MEQWADDSLHLDLDPKFKEDVRDCRAYLLSDKIILEKYKTMVMDQMNHSGIEKSVAANLSSNFKYIVKAQLKIGEGISKSSEFEDIVEGKLE